MASAQPLQPSIDLSPNWRQVALAALTQNIATGLTFGTFGTLVLAIERDLGASRTTSSLAMSALILSLSLTAAVLGRLLVRRSIRRTMILGAIGGAAGFVALSFGSTPAALVAIYGLVLGPCTAMLGVLPSNTHAVRWTPAHLRGRALGLVNTPLMVMVAPLAAAWVLEQHGLRATYGALAAVQLLALPIVLAVRDAPLPATVDAGDRTGDMPSFAILSRSAFWIMIVAVGLVVGAGTMKLAHLVPLLTEQGWSFADANLLLALSGGAGLLGSVVFGTSADRVGAAPVLVVNALAQAAMWTIFLAPVSLGWLVLDAIVVGICGGGVQSALGALNSRLFGSGAYSRVAGLSSLFTLPFLFGLSPLTSILREQTGSYHLAVGAVVGGFLIAATLFAFLIRPERRGAHRPGEVR